MYTQAKQKFGFLNWICCSYINSVTFSSVLKIGLIIIFTLIALFPQVIILWTANTERFCDVRAGLNDTAENLLNSIYRDEADVSPSTIFAVASILEGVAYINGSPQNTFVPGCIELAEKHNVSSVLGISSYFSFSSSPLLLPLSWMIPIWLIMLSLFRTSCWTGRKVKSMCFYDANEMLRNSWLYSHFEGYGSIKS